VTGFGVAGTFSGSYITIGVSAPPEKRPAMTGFMESAYAIASVMDHVRSHSRILFLDFFKPLSVF
jgi:hypothetical protein